jgi:hypothetical protein
LLRVRMPLLNGGELLGFLGLTLLVVAAEFLDELDEFVGFADRGDHAHVVVAEDLDRSVSLGCARWSAVLRLRGWEGRGT